jgi:hypothetical protein
MTNKEMVAQVLGDYGAMTSRQIAVQINNKLGVILTPAQIAGAVRPLIARGEAASSKDERNQTRYWLVNRV